MAQVADGICATMKYWEKACGSTGYPYGEDIGHVAFFKSQLFGSVRKFGKVSAVLDQP